MTIVEPFSVLSLLSQEKSQDVILAFIHNHSVFNVVLIGERLEIQNPNRVIISSDGPLIGQHYFYAKNSFCFYIYVYYSNNGDRNGGVLFKFDFLNNRWIKMTLPRMRGDSEDSLKFAICNEQLISLGKECFLFVDERWESLNITITFSKFAIAVFDNDIYIHGGMNVDGSINDILYKIDLADQQLVKIRQIVPNYGHSMVMDANYTYILGGTKNTGIIYSKYKTYHFKMPHSLQHANFLFFKQTLISVDAMNITHYSHPLFTIRLPLVYHDYVLNMALFNQLQINQKVSVHISKDDQLLFNPKNYEYQTMEYAEFINKLQDHNIYLRSLHSVKPFKKPANIKTDYAELANYTLPPCIEELNGVVYSIPLRIASQHLKLWGHYDCLDNILIEYKGIKKVYLVPPKYYHDLKMINTCCPLKWDATTFKDMAHFTFTLHPGDHLYIPSGWIHFVESVTITMGVNIFYKHLKDELLPRDIYSGGDLINFTKAMKKMHEIRVLLATSGADPELLKMYTNRLNMVLEDLSETI